MGPTYAELGVVEHDADRDPLSYWRTYFYTDPKVAPVELLFDEEPEHRAIEELMLQIDAVTFACYPPMDAEPETAEAAAERVLAVARGMKSLADPDGVAALVASAAAYQSLYRMELMS